LKEQEIFVNKVSEAFKAQDEAKKLFDEAKLKVEEYILNS
jgi:hypothetical protein